MFLLQAGKRGEFLGNKGFFIAGMLVQKDHFFIEKLVLEYFLRKKTHLSPDRLA